MKNTYSLTFVVMMLVVLPSINFAFSQEPAEYLDRRVEIWNLFFRMMIIAFTIGAVVSGTMIWLVIRFRESNSKSTPTKYEGTGELDRI